MCLQIVHKLFRRALVQRLCLHFFPGTHEIFSKYFTCVNMLQSRASFLDVSKNSPPLKSVTKSVTFSARILWLQMLSQSQQMSKVQQCKFISASLASIQWPINLTNNQPTPLFWKVTPPPPLLCLILLIQFFHQVREFSSWLAKLPHEHKIVIAGLNHDHHRHWQFHHHN